MVFNDSAAKGQAQTRTFTLGFGREKGVDDIIQFVCRYSYAWVSKNRIDSRSVVADDDVQNAVFPSGFQGDVLRRHI